MTASLPAPVPCAKGTFKAASSNVADESCDICTAGNYCPRQGTITPVACPKYMYCEAGSSIPVACIDGQQCMFGETSQEIYTDCEEGHYCIKGKKAPCYAGYICAAGESTPIPPTSLCPKGYYCEEGTVLDATVTIGVQGSGQIPCPVGTYNSYEGLTMLSEC